MKSHYLETRGSNVKAIDDGQSRWVPELQCGGRRPSLSTAFLLKAFRSFA